MADKDVLILRILTHVVPECYYERMLDQVCSGIDVSLDYNNFVLYNKKCLDELSYEDVVWVWGLCRRMNKNTFGMMDMECCGVWEADTFFYNLDKDLVIVHSR